MIQVSMTEKTGVTLATAGMYCAENVQVTPREEILRKDEQEKAVTPSESAQDVVPDDGKVLSKVSVGAITPDIVGGLDARTFAADAVSAIEGKGVTVPEETKVGGMAALISDLPSGGGATEPYVEEVFNSAGDLIEAKMYGYKQTRTNMFYGCSKLNLVRFPDGLTSIASGTFADNYELYLTSLPAGLTKIDGAGFRNCHKLSITRLPPSIMSIGSYAFSSCKGTTSLTFEGTPESIDSNAFINNSQLTTINVPWAEGAVANAPWGATNATINYNYTEE